MCPRAARFHTQATGKLMGSFSSKINKNLEAGAELGNSALDIIKGNKRGLCRTL